MTEFRYAPKALLGDYVRAGIGLALMLPLTFAVPAGSVMQWIFALILLFFLLFGARTLARQHSRIVMDSMQIAIFSWRQQRLEWAKLAALKLSFFSTQRDRASGWMELTLKGDGTVIRIDSALDGFADIARNAADAARRSGATMNDATRANLASLGIEVPEPESSTAS
jgi:hypothetical protein